MWMDGIQVWSAVCSGTALTHQHFFQVVCGCPGGLFDAENFGKLFLVFFCRNRDANFINLLGLDRSKPHGNWCNPCLVFPHAKVTALLLFAFAAETNPRGMLNISRWCKPPVIW